MDLLTLLRKSPVIIHRSQPLNNWTQDKALLRDLRTEFPGGIDIFTKFERFFYFNNICSVPGSLRVQFGRKCFQQIHGQIGMLF